MAINLNDNFKINVGNPIDSKYLNSGNTAYVTTGEAIATISESQRYLGLTVLVDSGTTNVEYWWKEGVADGDLTEKKFASEQLVGDFITGATNLGFFSGTSGVQIIDLAFGFGSYIGLYISEYNNYYLDSTNIIRLGSVTHNGVNRRAYVQPLGTYSWIFSEATGTWVVINGDASENIDASTGAPLFTSLYEEEVWTPPTAPPSGTTGINITGILTTGTTLTLGNPIYYYKEDQNLHLRTIINDTPEYLNIAYDGNFIRFSGATSTLVGDNVGAGEAVFIGKTGSTMSYRTLTASGDTTIIEAADGSLIIHSAGATGLIQVDNVGAGEAEVYRDITGNTINLRTITGSGNTTVVQSGDTIIVDSTGAAEVFDDDIQVSIDAGKSFGKYETGETIPASGKTAAEVILLACFEAQPPSVTLTSAGNNVAFGESGKTVGLNFSYTINSLGASVATTVLEHRRGGVGGWSGFSITTGSTNYTHIIDDSADRFNTDVLNYRYTVTDTAGGILTVTHNVTPTAYAAPVMAIVLGGTVPSPQTQTVREKGNVTGGIAAASLNRTGQPLVAITDWALERRYDGGSYITLASASGLNTTVVAVSATADNTVPTSATSIEYRLTYTDEYTSGVGGNQSISFRYFSFWGYNTSIVLNETQIEALANSAFKTSQALTWSVTAAISEYTYYAYPSTFSDLTGILRDGIVEDITAWGKLTDVTVTNSYGEGLLYTVYRTNAPGAYTGNNLVFS